MSSLTSQSPGKLYIIAAPSGAGKTSLVHELIMRNANIPVSVSHPTRDISPGGPNGVHYNFVDVPRVGTIIEIG